MLFWNGDRGKTSTLGKIIETLIPIYLLRSGMATGMKESHRAIYFWLWLWWCHHSLFSKHHDWVSWLHLNIFLQGILGLALFLLHLFVRMLILRQILLLYFLSYTFYHLRRPLTPGSSINSLYAINPVLFLKIISSMWF